MTDKLAELRILFERFHDRNDDAYLGLIVNKIAELIDKHMEFKTTKGAE